MTRSSPAKLLGLHDRGSLKPGCIADISIYDPKKKIDEMFSKASYVFKDGENIVKDGKIIKLKKGTTQTLKLNFDKRINKDLQKWFDKFYSLDLETFVVDENFFPDNNFKIH